ncbi:response regulator (plasmid) [Bradyrhizobium barranii subsp. apii]|uniref:response regulator n=1 Tax=Bradyrhizobium barranii TaxID=2992140 RepID=UPI001AA1771F|nr:response regulator [Bradyrhizobium barranii]UPU01372.1 response regulator [Bradyrhizobium barranii subsp. apii]
MLGDTVTVLIVEDDDLVRTIVQEALVEGGFQALLVSSGEEALALLQGDVSKWHAVITDVNLQGGLDGWHVARRARELVSDIPVFFMTGAAAAEWSANGVPNSILLNKPFAPAQITIAVAQLLNARPTLSSI